MKKLSILKIKIKYSVLLTLLVAVCFSGLNIITAPQVHAQTSAQVTVSHCEKSFFGLEPWYQYMGGEFKSGTCDIQCFNVFDHSSPNNCGQSKSDIPLVLLAVVDDLLRIAGILAVAFIIYGAFEYVGSQGNSEVTARAQSMVVNALIGLVIAIIAVAAVGFIGNSIGGP
jgi:hypothetical protein